MGLTPLLQPSRIVASRGPLSEETSIPGDEPPERISKDMAILAGQEADTQPT